MNFSKNLKKIRLSRGLTQKELANLLYVSYCALRNWEQCRREPNYAILEKITQVLNCDYNDLLK